MPASPSLFWYVLQGALVYYMETFMALNAGIPTRMAMVGLAFVFAPAFLSENNEPPIGGITFHQAQKIAAERREQRRRREKAAARKLAQENTCAGSESLAPPARDTTFKSKQE